MGVASSRLVSHEIEVYYVPPPTELRSAVISVEKVSYGARSFLPTSYGRYLNRDGIRCAHYILLSMSPVRDICIPIVRGFRHRVKDNSQGGHYEVAVV